MYIPLNSVLIIQIILFAVQSLKTLPQSYFTLLHHPREDPLCSFALTLNSQPYPLATKNCFMDISYKWERTICGTLNLASFTERNVVNVHSCCSTSHYFAPFDGWIIFHCMFIPVTFCLLIQPLMDIWVVSNEQCCYGYSRTNVCVDMMFLFLWGRYLGVELLGHKIKSLKWLCHLTFPPTIYENSSFSTS